MARKIPALLMAPIKAEPPITCVEIDGEADEIVVTVPGGASDPALAASRLRQAAAFFEQTAQVLAVRH